MLLPVLLLMRDRPSDVGQAAFGATGDAATEAADQQEAVRTTPLREAVRTRSSVHMIRELPAAASIHEFGHHGGLAGNVLF